VSNFANETENIVVVVQGPMIACVMRVEKAGLHCADTSSACNSMSFFRYNSCM
jgi:hypothetical protein